MRSRSLSFKLFLATSLALVGMITITMVLQLVFFERYYEHQKSGAFKRDFAQLVQQLKNDPDTAGMEALTPFESKNYALAGIGSIRDGHIMLQLGKGGEDDRALLQKRFAVQKPDPGTAKLPYNLLYTAIPNPEAESLTYALTRWMKDESAYRTVMVQKETLFEVMSSGSGPASAKQLVAVAPLDVANGEGTFAIAAASFQPVGDAVRSFRSFYPYFYLIAVVIVLLLAYLYSNLITKPLRVMNKVALKMARLDFTEKSAIRRDDEIGNLSDTLNFLSDNLRRSLDDLQAANAKLQQDIEKEKRLEQLRREFVAGVSHDLKTPISLIGGYAEGLLDNVQEGKKRERYARIILEEANRMAGMVKDMLDLSQLEAGQYRLQLEVFALDDWIRAVAAKYEPVLEARSLELALEPASVRADRRRIEQVLANLLDNAIRHTAADGRIRIEADVHGERVYVTVWNEGEPIPEKELPHIWDHFYKLEKSRSRSEPDAASDQAAHGSGIGLSIVRQIILLHGGGYGVRNTADGVAFRFDVPIVRDRESCNE